MKLPEYTIDGTVFNVNSAKLQLEQADNPNNVISFNEMDYRGSYYLMHYDAKAKNLPDIKAFNSGETVLKQIPQLIELDPEGMAARQNLSTEQLYGKNDFEVLVNQDLLNRRLTGILPVVDIAGHDFIFDNRLKELRAVDSNSTPIQLRNLEFLPDEQIYIALYHQPSRAIAEVDPSTITNLPKDVVLLEIPIEAKLDPVGFAREHDLELRNTLLKYPLSNKQVITVVDLKETLLPELVKRNSAKHLQSQQKPEKQVKKNRGPRL